MKMREHNPEERGTRVGRRLASGLAASGIVAATVAGVGVGTAGVALAGCGRSTDAFSVVTVHKTDSESGKPLAGATFKVTDPARFTGVAAVSGDELAAWEKVVATGQRDADKIAKTSAAFANAPHTAYDAYAAALAAARDRHSQEVSAASDAVEVAKKAAVADHQKALDRAEAAYQKAGDVFSDAVSKADAALKDAQSDHDTAVKDAQGEFDAATADFNALVAQLQQQADAAYATWQQEKQWLADHPDAIPDESEPHFTAMNAAGLAHDMAAARLAVLYGNANDTQVALDQDGTLTGGGHYDADHKMAEEYASASDALAQATDQADTDLKAAQEQHDAAINDAADTYDAAEAERNQIENAPFDVNEDPGVVKAQKTLDAVRAEDPTQDPAVLKLVPAKDAEAANSQKLADAMNAAEADLGKALDAARKFGTEADAGAKTAVTTDSNGDAHLLVIAGCGADAGPIPVTLTETKAPAGHHGLNEPVVVQVPGLWAKKTQQTKVVSAPDGVALSGVTRSPRIVDAAGPANAMAFTNATVTIPNAPVEKPKPPVTHKPTPPVPEAPDVPTVITAGSGTPANPAGEIAGVILIGAGLAGAGTVAYRRRRATAGR